MKTLILTVSAGHGHNAAAQAISEYIMHQDPSSDVRIVDTLKYISPVLDKVLIGSYLNALQVYPRAFTYLYSIFDKRDDNIVSLMEKVDELIAWRILPLIRESLPEVIISTHPFTTQMLSVLREEDKLRIPTLSIITDYGSHALWVHPHIDYYVVAHESVVPELVERGRSAETVLPLGIPVRTTFHEPFSREETLRSIGLTDDCLTVTLMGGSLALGNIKTILKELDSIPRTFNIVVVAGNNEKVYDEAVEISLRSEKSIAVLKFCHFMDALLQATDLLVTKPGGLTITESLITGTPLAIFKAIGGQEEQNRQFLLKNDLAISIGTGEDSAGLIEALLFHETRLHDMKERTKRFAKPHSTEAIYQLLEQMIREYEQIPAWAAVHPMEEDEGLTDKFKTMVEDIKLKLESNRVASGILELMHRRRDDAPEDAFFELSDEEINGLRQNGGDHPPGKNSKKLRLRPRQDSSESTPSMKR